jgi:3-methyl-2-oxobutanoate hydroxymethyltransferase
MSSSISTSKMLNISDLIAMKRAGEKICSLTAYDASFASLVDKAGVDMILIGDSLGMVIQGHSTTLPVTLEHMVYHCRCVSIARQRAFIVADLPFASYATPEQALHNAACLMQSAGVQMVKLEGAKLDVIRFLVDQGVPVCGHLGLLPQSVHCIGGYKVQGRETAVADRIIQDAINIERAGAGMLILECVPAQLAKEISQQLLIPVIGIGAGVHCDGQVLVLYDMLGISVGGWPRFSKNFMADATTIEQAIRDYHLAVKSLAFPDSEHSY